MVSLGLEEGLCVPHYAAQHFIQPNGIGGRGVIEARETLYLNTFFFLSYDFRAS